MADRVDNITMTLTDDVTPKLRKMNPEWKKQEEYLRELAKVHQKYNDVAKGAVIAVSSLEKGVKAASAAFKVSNKNLLFAKGRLSELTEATKLAIAADKTKAIAIKQGQRALQSYNIETKKQIVIEQQSARLDKSAQVRKGVEALRSFNKEKQRAISLEKAHAIALQENVRWNKRVAQEAARHIASQKRIAASTIRTTKAQKDMILSTKGIERVLSILIIRRIFHQLITQMREAITTSIDFQKALTEIQTIAQTAQAPLGQWAESIRKVSSAWDIGLLDSANARYQILSNQVAKGIEETERFQATASAFAKVTKTTATSAVDVLSSALNAYGKSAVYAEDVSAQLFKTIELGRIRSEDISGSFGRVVVVAAQLGIELAEVGATMAIITNKGVKASETMTLLRGVMMKLIRPTERMLELYAEWGVRTGEEAIATFGWLGVFQKIEEATRGSASEIGIAMGRIRATMGVTAAISDLEKFNDVLIQIRDTSKESYQKALEIQFQTSGERISKEMNELKNTLASGIGTEIISVLDHYNTNIKSITESVQILIREGITLGIVIGLVFSAKKVAAAYAYLVATYKYQASLSITTARTLTAAQAQTAYNATIAASQALLSAGLIIALYLAVTAITVWRKSVKETQAAIKRLDDAYAQYIANQTSEILKQRTEYERSIELFRRAGQEALQANAKIVVSYNAMVLALEKRIETEEAWLKEHQAGVEQDIKFTIDEYTEMYKILTKEAEEYGKTIDKLRDQRKDFREKIFDKIEENTRSGLSDADNVKRVIDQYKLLAEELKNQNLTIDERKKKLADILRVSIDITKFETDIDKSSKRSRAESEAAARKNFNRFTGRRGPKLSTKLNLSDRVDQNILDREKERLQEILSLGERVYDQEISRLTEFQSRALILAKEVKDEYREIAVIINEIMELLSKPAIKNLVDKDILSEVAKDAIEKGVSLEISADKEFKDSIKTLRNTLAITEPINKTIEVIKKQEIALNANTDAILAEITSQTKELRQAETTRRESENKLGDTVKTLDESLSDLDAFFNSIRRIQITKSFFDFGIDETQLDDISKLVQENIALDKLTVDQKLEYVTSLEELSTRLKEVPKLFLDEESFPTREGTLQQFTNFQKHINNLITAAEDSANAYTTANEKIPAIEESLASTRLLLQGIKKNSQAFGNIIKTYEHTIQSVNKVQMVEIQKLLITFGQSLAIINEQLKTSQLNRATERLQARGGSVWGTDTVPTRLTPGEFVMNQRATRQFYGQLVSMNNGSMSSAASGDYSTHVGDISIGVTGGDTSRQTISGIVSGLRREIHRGKLARL